MQLKFFDTPAGAASFAVEAIISELADDLERMSFTQDHLYSDAERKDQRALLDDIRATAPLMMQGQAMLPMLKECLIALNEIPNTGIEALNNKPTCALAREITALIRELEPVVSPVQLAKEATPFWFETIHNYNGLEITPVAEFTDKQGCRFCEQVDNPGDARYWSVYGHLAEGGVQCLEDFPSEDEALAFANKLLAMFPQLREYGLAYS